MLVTTLESGDRLLTCAALVRVPTLFGVTIIVAVTRIPLFRSPKLQLTKLPVCAGLLAVDVAKINCTFTGSVSVNRMLVAELGSFFVTTTQNGGVCCLSTDSSIDGRVCNKEQLTQLSLLPPFEELEGSEDIHADGCD